MKILRFLLLPLLGLVSAVIIQFSFKFQREIYPLLLAIVLFFVIGLFAKKIIVIKINPLILKA